MAVDGTVGGCELEPVCDRKGWKNRLGKSDREAMLGGSGGIWRTGALLRGEPEAQEKKPRRCGLEDWNVVGIDIEGQ